MYNPFCLTYMYIIINIIIVAFLQNARNQSRNMKFKCIVVNENNSDKFDIGHCRTKVKVTPPI